MGPRGSHLPQNCNVLTLRNQTCPAVCYLTSPQNGNDLKKSNGYGGIRDIMFFCEKDYKTWTDIYNLCDWCSSVNITYCSHN